METERKNVVLVGDEHYCPQCEKTSTVTSGSSHMTIMNRGVARMGDLTSCGAIIEEGSDSLSTEGKPIAYTGCHTSHGGTLKGSASMWLG